MFEHEIMKGLGMLSQELFWKLLRVERKRTERSDRGFVLMLVNLGNDLRPQVLSRVILAIGRSIRDTDLAGWYKEGAIIGVIFTEVRTGQDKSVVQGISTRVMTSLYAALTIGEVNEVQLSFHVFPEDWHEKERGGPLASMLQIELAREYGIEKKSRFSSNA